MKLQINESEVREAVIEWLEAKGVKVDPAKLRPLTETHGMYEDEDREVCQVGYELDLTPTPAEALAKLQKKGK